MIDDIQSKKMAIDALKDKWVRSSLSVQRYHYSYLVIQPVELIDQPPHSFSELWEFLRP